jgi:hypothetical protein
MRWTQTVKHRDPATKTASAVRSIALRAVKALLPTAKRWAQTLPLAMVLILAVRPKNPLSPPAETEKRVSVFAVYAGTDAYLTPLHS